MCNKHHYPVIQFHLLSSLHLILSRSIGVRHTLESKKEMDTGLETEMKLEKIRRSHQEKESQEMEQLRQRQAEAELELEELKKKREERRRFREEEEQRKEEEEQLKLTIKEVSKYFIFIIFNRRYTHYSYESASWLVANRIKWRDLLIIKSI